MTASAEPSELVVRKFSKRIALAIGYHRELLLAVHLKKHEAALQTMLAEQFVLNSAVLWEVFLHELLITYLTMDCVPFLKNLQTRVQQSVRERYGSEAFKTVAFNLPVTMSFAKA